MGRVKKLKKLGDTVLIYIRKGLSSPKTKTPKATARRGKSKPENQELLRESQGVLEHLTESQWVLEHLTESQWVLEHLIESQWVLGGTGGAGAGAGSSGLQRAESQWGFQAVPFHVI